MSDLVDREALCRYALNQKDKSITPNDIMRFPSAQPDITDEQAIEHLQESGWMQNHDKQMYEMGLRERLADDSGSYDALLPSVQPEKGAVWYKPTGMMPPEHAGHWECSNCGFWAMRDWLRPRVVLTKFCPNCGKPMKNGGDNEQN